MNAPDIRLSPTGRPVTMVDPRQYRTDLAWADVVVDGRGVEAIASTPLPERLERLPYSYAGRAHVPATCDMPRSKGHTITGYVLDCEDPDENDEVTGTVLTLVEYPDGFTGAAVSAIAAPMDDLDYPGEAVWAGYRDMLPDAFAHLLCDVAGVEAEDAHFERAARAQMESWRTAVCDPDAWLGDEPPSTSTNPAAVLNEGASFGFTSHQTHSTFAAPRPDWRLLTEALEMAFDINTPAAQRWLEAACEERWDLHLGLRIVRMAARDGWTPAAFKALNPSHVVEDLWGTPDDPDSTDDTDGDATALAVMERWSALVGYRDWMRLAGGSGHRAAMFVAAGFMLDEAREMVSRAEAPSTEALACLAAFKHAA